MPQLKDWVAPGALALAIVAIILALICYKRSSSQGFAGSANIDVLDNSDQFGGGCNQNPSSGSQASSGAIGTESYIIFNGGKQKYISMPEHATAAPAATPAPVTMANADTTMGTAPTYVDLPTLGRVTLAGCVVSPDYYADTEDPWGWMVANVGAAQAPSTSSSSSSSSTASTAPAAQSFVINDSTLTRSLTGQHRLR